MMNTSYSRPTPSPPPLPVGWLAWGDVGGPPPTVVEAVDDGVRLVDGDQLWDMAKRHKAQPSTSDDLLCAIAARHSRMPNHTVLGRLVLPTGRRWQEAFGTALLGPWAAALARDGFLSCTALSVLRAETRTLHRQLTPIWRRRTRHGRVLSLDAPLGDCLSLYNLVAAHVDQLAHTLDGVFEDERLNRVLRCLDPTERAVVYAYAEGEGTTWAESAAVIGVPDPAAFGERVRRKAKRLAAEQVRRAAFRHPGPFTA